MWTRAKCGEENENAFDACWKCSTPRGEIIPEAPPQLDIPPKRRLTFRMFRGTWAPWERLFEEAANFANEIGPERVVSISHSEDKDDGVVAVWYWTSGNETDV
jgi:hypothetical protein